MPKTSHDAENFVHLNFVCLCRLKFKICIPSTIKAYQSTWSAGSKKINKINLSMSGFLAGRKFTAYILQADILSYFPNQIPGYHASISWLYSFNLVLFSDFQSIVYHRNKSHVTYIDYLDWEFVNRGFSRGLNGWFQQTAESFFPRSKTSATERPNTWYLEWPIWRPWPIWKALTHLKAVIH